MKICVICGKIKHSTLIINKNEKETIQKIINFVITVLTAVLSSFCVQSCK
ncbi:smalltalk protein [Segatella copri]